MPGVQNPHWLASASTIARWRGWSRPFAASPSTVRSALPASWGTVIRQLLTASWRSPPPSGMPRTTVQAPQSPSAQPSLVPVRRFSVLSQSSTVVAGGTSRISQGSPLSRIRIDRPATPRPASSAIGSRRL